MSLGLVGWGVVAVILAVAVGQLVALRTALARRGGAHARNDLSDPAARRKEWHQVRVSLLAACNLASVLLVHGKHTLASWLVGLVVFAVASSEVRAWLGLTSAAARRAGWSELGLGVISAVGELYILLDWHSDLALSVLAGVFLIMIAPDLDSWFRAWLRRRNTWETDDG